MRLRPDRRKRGKSAAKQRRNLRTAALFYFMKGRTAGFMLENHLWLELEMDRINLMMLAILIVAILFYSKDKGAKK